VEASSNLRPRIFRYSTYDAVLVLGGVANSILLIALAIYFDRLPLWVLVPAFVVVAFCYTWNMNAIAHNFIHNPFFVSRWLNRAYSVLLSTAVGVPQTMYHHYHLTHHWGDNDTRGEDGKTRDLTSSYRYGKDGEPEGFWRYSLLSLFRFEFGTCFRMILQYGRWRLVLVAAEAVVLAAFWLLLGLINWRFFLFFYLPSYYAGWVWSYAQNYVLHYGAQPGNRYANAICSYQGLYNLIFFNNGYHQEHHCEPKTHWTRMREVRERIQPYMIANHTRVLRGPHITVFFEDWIEGRRRSSSPRAEESAS
jgi:fatty acid desaturase